MCIHETLYSNVEQWPIMTSLTEIMTENEFSIPQIMPGNIRGGDQTYLVSWISYLICRAVYFHLNTSLKFVWWWVYPAHASVAEAIWWCLNQF